MKRASAVPPPRLGDGAILRTRVGRRFLLLFVGAALLPLLAFAWLLLGQAGRELRVEAERVLHHGAKTAGMGLAARLSQVAGDFALVRDALGAAPAQRLPLQQRLRERAVALARRSRVGAELLFGAALPPVPPLDAVQQAHLASGQPLLCIDGGSGRVLLRMLVAAGGDDELLLEIAPQWLFDAQELRAPGAEVAVFDDRLRPLFRSAALVPERADLAAAIDRSPASGALDWRAAAAPQLARYWRLFLRPQYGADLLVVQSRARADVFAAVHGFERWFVLTAACTLLVVLVVGLVQMRRMLEPIVGLHEATRRIAAGDLEARVVIRGRDELAALGTAFNHMTAQLAESERQRRGTEQELVASRDAALAAAKAKAEFVTNVSHEFRTPMAELLGATEILAQLSDDDPAARAEFTAIACAGAQRLARLVDDVLALGTAASWPTGPVDPGAVVRDAVAQQPERVRARVRLGIAPSLPLVEGNAGRLTDVFRRLLDNAAKFSPTEAPIDVRVAAARGEVVVEVVDQGVGISRLDLERIFEPFHQAGRDQLTDKAHGTGLGLTLARSVVERHGGRIEVDSELGNGATFRVVLPARAAAPAPAPAAVASAAAEPVAALD